LLATRAGIVWAWGRLRAISATCAAERDCCAAPEPEAEPCGGPAVTWKAKIVCDLGDGELKITSIYEDLSEFVAKIDLLDERTIVKIDLRPINRAALLALRQKNLLKRRWRMGCQYCGGSGWREPTGEAHCSPGLVECDQCRPLPFQILKGGSAPEA
jgi:hypothetical protein